MSPEVEKHLKKILQCTQQSSERVYSAAYDRVGEIAKLGKRKPQRQSAMEALQEIALKAYAPLRGRAANDLADLLSPADTESLPFLRKGLKSKDIDYGCVFGLLQVLGADAYSEIVPIILDSKRSLDSRSSALDALCEHSGHPFNEDLPLYGDMKPADLPLKPLRAWADAGFPAYVATKAEVPVSALAKLGITLPKDYLEFLRQHRRSVRYKYGNSLWELTTAANLLSKINIDGKAVPSVQLLKRHGAVLKQAIDADATEDCKGKPYPLARLGAGIALGSDDSGDVLYLDPSDQDAVWVFHHDGGDVERAAKSFGAWLRKAAKEAD